MLLIAMKGTAANGEIQSERLLLARPSISAVACMLDYLMKHLQQQSSTMNSVASRLAMALAGCAQRSTLGNSAQSTNHFFKCDSMWVNRRVLHKSINQSYQLN